MVADAPPRIVIEFDPETVESEAPGQHLHEMELHLSLSAEFERRYIWDEEPVRRAQYAAWLEGCPSVVGTGSTPDEALASLATALQHQPEDEATPDSLVDLLTAAKSMLLADLVDQLGELASSPVLSDHYALVLRGIGE